MPQTGTRTRAERTGWLWVAFCVIAVTALAGCGKQLTGIDKARHDANRNPKSVDAQIALGQALYEEQKYNDAYVAFKRALKLAPSDVAPMRELSRVNLKLANAEGAIKWGDAALKVAPKDAITHWSLGRAYMLKSEPEKALRHLEQAIASDASLADPAIDLVYVNAALGRNDEALAAAARAVKAHPKEARAHYTYADTLTALKKQPKLAEKHYRESIKIEPDNHMAMLRLASLLMDSGGKVDEARELAQTSHEIEPGDGTASAVAAWALFKMGKEKEGLQELLMATQAHPLNNSLWILFAKALKEQGLEEPYQQAMRMVAQTAPRPAFTPDQRRKLALKLREQGGEGLSATDVREVLQDLKEEGSAESGSPAADQPPATPAGAGKPDAAAAEGTQ